MPRKSIGRVEGVYFLHQTVAGDLRHDTGGSNAQTDAIAADNGRLGYQEGMYGQPIN